MKRAVNNEGKGPGNTGGDDPPYGSSELFWGRGVIEYYYVIAASLRI